MAFPDSLLAAASTWFTNAFIGAPLIQTWITDPLNALATRLTGIGQGFVGDANSSSSVTLAVLTTDVAGLAPVTFTLASTRRVKISTTVGRYTLGSATSGRMLLSPAYNSGASPVIGSATKPAGAGAAVSVYNSSGVSGAGGGEGGAAFATALLTAGTYTAYAAVQRVTGGNAADTAVSFYTLVEDLGSV